MKGNKFLAAVLAASMAFSAVPVTAINAFAAAGDVTLKTVKSTTDGQTFTDGTIAAAPSDEKSDVTSYVTAAKTAATNFNSWDTDEEAESSTAITALKTDATIAPTATGITYSTENVTYDAATNKYTFTVKALNTHDTTNKTFKIYTAELESNVSAAAELQAVVDSIANTIDAEYDVNKTAAVNCKNMQDKLIAAIKEVTGGTVTIGDVSYTPGTSAANGDKYTATTIKVTGSDESGKYDATVASKDINATSTADKLLDQAYTLINTSTFTAGTVDPTTTAAEITADVQKALDDSDTDFSSVNVSTEIDSKKSTDTSLVGTITLSIGDKKKTISFTKTISNDAIATDVVSHAFTGTDYVKAIKYNFTTDDSENKATALDKTALAAALTKVANAYIEKNKSEAGDPTATVTIDTYKEDSTTGNGYARGQVTVTRNGKAGDPVDFLINASYSGNTLQYSGSATVLFKADNQKLAEAASNLDKKVKANADLQIKNTRNTTNAPTESQIKSGVRAVAEANDGSTTVKSVDVKSYTAPTSSEAGTAVVTVTYTVPDDADATKTVTCAHDITLTFKALKAKKTTTLSFDTVPTLWYGSSAKNTNHYATSADLKDYLNANGNSGLTWTSSDESVASVDEDGVVTATGLGKATITATVADNSKVSATVDITVSSVTKFKDVTNPSAYYYQAVVDAVTDGITSGVSEDEFGVNQPVTRGQFVTWLYHKAGDPATTATTKFTDVSSTSYYAKAVAWAVKNGITAGTSATTFSPNKQLTRAEAVCLLYAYKARPAYNSSISSGFTDVNTGDYYYDAVQWAFQNGVTAGKTTTSFAPKSVCSRAEAIVYLMSGNV